MRRRSSSSDGPRARTRTASLCRNWTAFSTRPSRCSSVNVGHRVRESNSGSPVAWNSATRTAARSARLDRSPDEGLIDRRFHDGFPSARPCHTAGRAAERSQAYERSTSDARTEGGPASPPTATCVNKRIPNRMPSRRPDPGYGAGRAGAPARGGGTRNRGPGLPHGTWRRAWPCRDQPAGTGEETPTRRPAGDTGS